MEDGVLGKGLCTGCGACVDLCPYLTHYRDRTVLLHACDRDSGRCSLYCPRTLVNLEEMQQALFDPADLTPELGAIKGLYLTRARDVSIRTAAQHGGTVTALISLALEAGLIDQAVLAGEEGELLPRSEAVSDPSQAQALAGSKFAAAPNVAAFNRASRTGAGRIGVVATPCQAQALAKMRLNAPPEDRARVDRLKLVVGLFCGWALDWRKLKSLLSARMELAEVRGLDIPPSKFARMEVKIPDGTRDIPIDEVIGCVRESCGYCLDLTAEFADLSVGSARSPEGWEVDQGWNQLIVRTGKGQELVDLALEEKALELKEAPAGNLERLKKAALNKKRTCLANLEKRTGNKEELIYLNPHDGALRAFRESQAGAKGEGEGSGPGRAGERTDV